MRGGARQRRKKFERKGSLSHTPGGFEASADPRRIQLGRVGRFSRRSERGEEKRGTHLRPARAVLPVQRAHWRSVRLSLSSHLGDRSKEGSATKAQQAHLPVLDVVQ